MFPQSYPNYKTVHRRFQQWVRQDILRSILIDLAHALDQKDRLDPSESYIDAIFANGGGGVIPPKNGGVQKLSTATSK